MIEEARRRIATALRPGGLCVLTGAGMSAESGIATFRDALTGYWTQFDPVDLASEEGFRAHPQRVWDWYAERREGVRRAAPNAGHWALGRFALRHPDVLRVVSQNVDDLHQRAGNEDTVRLHGDIQQDGWLEPCPNAARGKACNTVLAEPGRPPRCAECGNLVRPGVVWFGEPLPIGAMTTAEKLADGCAVMLVIGTSGVVWPAAGLAGRARRRGAWVAVINPQASEVDDDAQAVLRGTAATILPSLLDGV